MSKPVILTGLRTNAEYHLGNYLGAILPMVELQKKHLGEYQVNMFAPDLHSFTTPIDHAKLHEQSIRNLKVFVAAGMPLGHEDFFMYRQSYIPAHSELTVILNNFAYMGELSRMTQFKEKGGEDAAGTNVTAGLFDYPVLMAADILLYGSKYVPVGDDQRQHLEVTRDLAERFNNKFGEIFIVPEPWDQQLAFAQRDEGVRIRSLKHPENKMSKSIDDPSGTILLSDNPEEAHHKVMSATTDSLGSISWNWEQQPGITNLLQIYQLLTSKTREAVLEEWGGQPNYGDFKSAVAGVVAEFLKKLSEDLSSVSETDLETKISANEATMAAQANETLNKVQQAVGLRPS